MQYLLILRCTTGARIYRVCTPCRRPAWAESPCMSSSSPMCPASTSWWSQRWSTSAICTATRLETSTHIIITHSIFIKRKYKYVSHRMYVKRLSSLELYLCLINLKLIYSFHCFLIDFSFLSFLFMNFYCHFNISTFLFFSKKCIDYLFYRLI